MPTYAVGDVQGCYKALRCLMKKIKFDPKRDTLWLAGDLVNRGPQSLEVLRLAKSLGKRARIVLGNHDLHLLAIAYGVHEARQKDTLDAILRAPDRKELIDWLRRQPLIHSDKQLGYSMVHAGIAPIWSLKKAHKLAAEVEAKLQSKKIADFLSAMYGNEPQVWRDDLRGSKRLRTITNYLTRMRFCTRDGKLDLDTTDSRESSRPDFAPWFDYGNDQLAGQRIVFGHWAALEGKSNSKRFHALDTGCVWGGQLTAMRLEDGKRFHCDCNSSFANSTKQ
jgi:bis(5'-nucleosyl)-tetraphosphatase (symmetrical)